jgi:FkbM family methyltransferase
MRKLSNHWQRNLSTEMRNHTNGFAEKLMRQLPNFKGKRRIARLLFSEKLKHGKDVVVMGLGGCCYKLPNLLEYLAQEIFVNGIYEPDTHSFLMKHIPRNGIFLDLGANIGSILIPLCKARPDIRCVAVEASPVIFGYLQNNLALNQLEDRVICMNKAITDTEAGQLPFYSPTDQFGKGSLAPVFTETPIMVETVTIDKLLADLDIESVSTIKIDIEGYEYAAFKGGESLLSAKNAPDILFEFVDWAEDMAGRPKGSAQLLLKKLGYALYTMNKKGLSLSDEIIDTGDQLFFATKKHLKDLTQ